jgi:hypothetical protein
MKSLTLKDTNINSYGIIPRGAVIEVISSTDKKVVINPRPYSRGKQKSENLTISQNTYKEHFHGISPALEKELKDISNVEKQSIQELHNILKPYLNE